MSRKKNKTGTSGLVRGVAGMLVILLLVVLFRQAYIRWKYPLKYTNLVQQYAAEYGVDENLVYSGIQTESGFDSYAVSEVGARGLMQMTEETFEWVQTKIGGNETFDDLYQPEVSIRYGTYLLHYLLREFDNDTDTAMAAYHAGIASVRSWLQNPANSPDGKRLTHIPKSDTEHYVNKINRAMAIYQKRNVKGG